MLLEFMPTIFNSALLPHDARDPCERIRIKGATLDIARACCQHAISHPGSKYRGIGVYDHFHSTLQHHLTYSTIPNLVLQQQLHVVHLLLAFSSVMLRDQEQLYRPEVWWEGPPFDERLERNLWYR